MSYSTVSIILERISVATPRSPLVVFTVEDKPGFLRVAFASTVTSQQEIKTGKGLVGVFARTSQVYDIQKLLEDSVCPI